MNIKSTLQFLVILAVFACGTESKKDDSLLVETQKALKESYGELKKIKIKITGLEEKIRKINPSASLQITRKQVAVFKMKPQTFEHKLQFRGSLKSRKNIDIKAQMIGSVDRIHVKEGDQVKKGDLLVSINADVLRNTIAEYKTSLELASSLYDKRKKLWAQKVGSEIQYLEAKNRRESLEKKLATAYSKLNYAVVKAPFSGMIENAYIKEGELAQQGTLLVKIANFQDMYIQADISEVYIGKIHLGDKADIFFPFRNKTMTSFVKAVGQEIHTQNRTFDLEFKIPKIPFSVKPNQIVIVHFYDYHNPRAWVVPTQVILEDSRGRYVLCSEKKNQKNIIKKIYVETGLSYKGETEIIKGLDETNWVVNKGLHEVKKGDEVMIVRENSEAVKRMRKRIN